MQKSVRKIETIRDTILIFIIYYKEVNFLSVEWKKSQIKKYSDDGYRRKKIRGQIFSIPSEANE